MQKPTALKPGDTIAIAAPASCFDREAFLAGVKRIEMQGFRVVYREDIFDKQRYLAGSDARRFSELQQYLQDETVKAIFIARGGYGAMRLLPQLDKLTAPVQPKILMGYSDLTSLLNYVQQRWDWVVFHGPVVAKDISEGLSPEGEAWLWRVLKEARPLGTVTAPGMTTLYSGIAQGKLVGGCLSLIVHSLGTPYQLKTEGSILFLEDVGEKLYAIDRMLTQLRQAGLLSKIHGIVFGPLKDAHDKPEVIRDWLVELLGDLKIPILFGFPSGHVRDARVLPFGLPVVLDAGKQTIEFTEGALT